MFEDLRSKFFQLIEMEKYQFTEHEEVLLKAVTIISKWVDNNAEGLRKVKKMSQDFNPNKEVAFSEQLKNLTRSEFNCLYTDGGCIKSQGAAAFAFIPSVKDKIEKKYASVTYSKGTTNNKEELKAVINGLEYLRSIKKTFSVLVISDSLYVVNIASKHWKANKNTALWDRFWELEKHFGNLRFKWVKGHSGCKYNNYVDHLASESMKHKKNFVVTT